MSAPCPWPWPAALLSAAVAGPARRRLHGCTAAGPLWCCVDYRPLQEFLKVEKFSTPQSRESRVCVLVRNGVGAITVLAAATGEELDARLEYNFEYFLSNYVIVSFIVATLVM